MKYRSRDDGFTLIEIAMVLIILGLLTQSMIQPLAGLRQDTQHRQTLLRIEQIKQSVLAYLVAHGALPCPVSSLNRSNDPDNATGANTCIESVGGVPAERLALSGAMDDNGALLDEWGRVYRYAISPENSELQGDSRLLDWATSGDASEIGIGDMRGSLTLCTKPADTRCPNSATRANNIAFVVVSHGPDTSSNPLQLENLDDDVIYFLGERSNSSATVFDDYLVWASAEEALYWMLRAGWLP